MERVVCQKTQPESVLQDLYCNVKFASRYHLKINGHWNITQPTDDVWLHGVLNYKFNGLVYQKFPIDLWEDVCAWLNGKRKAYILDWTFGRILNFTNIGTCPFFGYYYVRASNVSMEDFVVEPLLPSGRYRLDLQFMHRMHDLIPFVKFEIYFSVSDHRLEII